MITIEKLNIYIKYEGDIDMFERTGKSKERTIMKTGDWYTIEGFLQDLTIVKDGKASTEFKNNLQVQLVENCENEKVIKLLKITSGYPSSAV